MRLTFASRDWAGKSKLPAPRHATAVLGIFAILLQAVLFGWHNHALPFSPRAALAVVAAAGHEVPGLVDDDCQICFALSHHSAAPVDFVAASASGFVPLHAPAIETVWAPAPPYLLFRSRAPPRA